MDEDDRSVSIVGEWTKEKHARLERYIDISRSVRRKFTGGAGATYIELFSGPGKSKIRESGELIEGSPVLAVSKAIGGKAPFTDVYLADIDEDHVHASTRRVERLGARVHPEVGPAESTVDRIVKQLNKYALHFAFLDPFNLASLPFSVIAKLAELNRMDILIHVSVHDLQRNLHNYLDEQSQVLDRFAPGWRQKVDPRAPPRTIRAQIFEHWLELIRGLQMAPARGVELVSGTRNQRLYWLVLVARHNRAIEFWDRIRSVSGQGQLPLNGA